MQKYVSTEKLHAVHAVALDDQPEHLSSRSGLSTYHHQVRISTGCWQDAKNADPQDVEQPVS